MGVKVKTLLKDLDNLRQVASRYKKGSRHMELDSEILGDALGIIILYI